MHRTNFFSSHSPYAHKESRHISSALGRAMLGPNALLLTRSTDLLIGHKLQHTFGSSLSYVVKVLIVAPIRGEEKFREQCFVLCLRQWCYSHRIACFLRAQIQMQRPTKQDVAYCRLTTHLLSYTIFVTRRQPCLEPAGHGCVFLHIAAREQTSNYLDMRRW